MRRHAIAGLAARLQRYRERGWSGYFLPWGFGHSQRQLGELASNHNIPEDVLRESGLPVMLKKFTSEGMVR